MQKNIHKSTFQIKISVSEERKFVCFHVVDICDDRNEGILA